MAELENGTESKTKTIQQPNNEDAEKKTPDQDAGKQEDAEFITAGFRFNTKEDARTALNEVNAIRYLLPRIEGADRDTLLKVYKNALEARTFQTPIGLEFMHQLQKRLLKMGVEDSQIPPVQLYVNYTKMLRKEANPARQRIRPVAKKGKIGLDRYTFSVLLNIFLLILVIGMFFIALTSDNANVLNYENVLNDRYAVWEQELSEREKNVKAKELELKRQGIELPSYEDRGNDLPEGE